jgi:hypothetical protein
MFKINRMAPEAVRLASFASRSCYESTKLPHPEELRKAICVSSTRECESCCECQHDFACDREELAAEILNSASNAPTWFFVFEPRRSSLRDCWSQTRSFLREIFYRLVTMEVLASIKKIQTTPDVVYPMAVTAFFHMASAAGACAFWFNGS